MLVSFRNDEKSICFPPGTNIIHLKRDKMGCVTFPIWIGVLIGFVILCLVIIVLVIHRKWTAIKFFLFMKFDILINDEEPENVDDMEFDAFVMYRWVLIS